MAARRVLLCGASSVGKTTLATDWCGKHKTYRHIEEVARDVMKNHSPPITQQQLKESLATDKELFLELQRLILEEQSRRETQLEGCQFISDRGPDPLVYARQKLPKDERATALEQSPIAQSALQRYRDQCYLVVVLSPLPGKPTDDGVRLVPASNEEQKQFTILLCDLLKEYRIPYVRVTESGRLQRLDLLERAVKGELPIDMEDEQVFPLNIPFFLTPKEAPQPTVLLRHVEITPNQTTICLSQPFSRGQSNRMLDRYGDQDLLLVSFHQKVSSNVVRKVLLKGLMINGVKYCFLGCSSSGLKDRKCYMLRGSLCDVERVWGECGDFSAIKSVSKRLKRIGLLFSAAWPSRVVVPDQNFLPVVEDVETSAGNFTDGCGAIGTELATAILQGALPQLELGEYLPSVLQIRYQGCKGVVVRDGHTNVKPECLMIRKSMKKFESGTNPFREVWLCDYSRPYSYGFLNKQFIMLFTALGIGEEVFIHKQAEHLEHVARMKGDPTVAIQMFLLDNQPGLVGRVAKIHTQEAFLSDRIIQKELHRLQGKFVEKMSKLSIPVLKSRNIFGVCDPTGVLEYGECFLRLTIDGKPTTINGKVTIAKNPCYMLGDVRLLNAVAGSRTRNLEHLVDCIVFPLRGKRPHPAEIAGSDLDGDQYFVTWDSDLLIPSPQEPYDYPSVEHDPVIKVTPYKAMIDYFASYKKYMGQIDFCYKAWAEEKGVDSFQCQELGKLFSRSVDAAKTGDAVHIPPNLQPGKITSNPQEERVWKKMERVAEEKQRELKLKLAMNLTECCDVTEDFVWSVVLDKELSMSEYQYFLFVCHWCSGQVFTEEDDELSKLQEFCMHINFGEFTIEQQVEAMDAGVPKAMVTSDLNKSSLLEADMLEHFSLDSPHFGWRFYFHSSSSDLDWRHLLRAFQRHSETLLILQLPDNIRFTLHFQTLIKPGKKSLVAGNVVAYLFSPHFGLKLRHVLGDKYSVLLDLDKELLQLYRNNDVAQSFLWLSAKRKQQGRRQDGGEEFMHDRVSIDLPSFKRNILQHTQHPKINKQNFLSVEVFVRSHNHDPAFLDILVPDQPDLTYSDVLIDTDVIEDPPIVDDDDDDDDGEDGHTFDASNPGAAIVFLQRAATKGQLHHFLAAMEFLATVGDSSCQAGQEMEKAVNILLKSLVVKYSCKLPTTQLMESLQLIITTCHQQGCLRHPLSCLNILSRLSQLHCTALVEQMVSLLLPTLHLSSVSDYLEILRKWQLWFFFPSSVAHSVALRLYVLSQSLVEAHCGTQDEHKLQQSSERTDVHETDRYTCHFFHLLLLQLLCEASLRPQMDLQDTDTSLIKMRVYDYKNPRHQVIKDSNTESIQDQNNSSGDDVWKAGFTRPLSVRTKKFTLGSYVSISVMLPDSTSPEKVKYLCVALGKITEVTCHPANIVVDVQGPVSNCLTNSARLQKGHWQLTLVGNVTVFNRATKALQSLTTKPTELTSLICTSTYTPKAENQHKLDTTISPLPADSVTSVDTAVSFNPSQQWAISASLSQQLTLIHGPPGTGKTRIACEIVRCMVHRMAGKHCVLAVAETNMAVDNLTRCLLQLGLRVVRVGNREQVSADVRHVTLEQQIERKRVEDMKPKQKSPWTSKKSAKSVLSCAEIVTATCTGAGDPVLEGMRFPFVVVDEATQAIEPVTLIPIIHQCQQLTLIGDPQQLPPTIPGSDQTQDDDGPSLKCLSVSLFHRLQRSLPSFFLDEQHRMHPEIARFPSEVFYDGKLKSAAFTREPIKLACLSQKRPLLFIDVSCNEHRVGSSFENKREAEMVVEVVRSLLNNEVCLQEIAVLTPYVGQVQCIRQEVSQLAGHHLDVCTVDSFQGREKDVVIFSTVRCNRDGRLGFTDDKHRMNVLLTRAKRGVIGIGCQSTLCESPLWSKWLQQVSVITIEEFRQATDTKSSTQRDRDSQNSASVSDPRHHSSRHHQSRPSGRGGHRQKQQPHQQQEPDQPREQQTGGCRGYYRGNQRYRGGYKSKSSGSGVHKH